MNYLHTHNKTGSKNIEYRKAGKMQFDKYVRKICCGVKGNMKNRIALLTLTPTSCVSLGWTGGV